MIPVMHIISALSGAWGEKPQKTHKWNNRRLKDHEFSFSFQKQLLQKGLVVEGTPEKVRQGGIHFHLPFAGGWRKYTVLEPCSHKGIWYIGWILPNKETGGISLLPLTDKVRMLRGTEDTEFFGISEDGELIEIAEVGRGEIGDGSNFSKQIPLL